VEGQVHGGTGRHPSTNRRHAHTSVHHS
jgi:hypothetical protein